MATALGNKVPELIDNTWEDQSPSDRLRSIEKMQASSSSGKEALHYIAHNDEHTEVRCGAVRRIHDLDTLAELQKVDTEVAEVATGQYHRILAGTVATEIKDEARTALIRALSAPALKQVALLTKDKLAGTEAVTLIDQEEELADLSLFAASVLVRKQAAMKIEDKKLLTEIREKVRDKDKTVFKIVDQRLSDSAPPKAKPAAKMTSAQNKTKTAEHAKAEPQSDAKAADEPEVSIEATTEKQTAKSQNNREKNPDASSKGAAKETAKSTSKGESKNKDKNKSTTPKTPEPPLDPVVELPLVQEELAKLSYKHTDALNVVRNKLNKMRKSVIEGAAELGELAATLSTAVNEKLEKNRAHQEQLQKATEALLQQLQTALDAGQSHEALPTWDKIQGNISNASGKIRAAMQKQANVYKAKLNELRDWKTFASTEKKKELITQMQHLVESKMHAADRSKHISKMHQEWKSLGRSNQNETLWRDFKKLSDKAYEPCKEYFKQRKQLMASNLVSRREICDRLEAALSEIDGDNPMITELNKLMNQAEQDWKTHAPIEQSKIKAMQKRYYAAINQLRKLRKNSLRGNGSKKQEFINQANALAESEDRQHAMSEAKRLQQEWKKIGPTSFKEDKKYWEDFRAACDKIFEKRNQEMSAQREGVKQAEGKLAELLQGMEAVFKLEDEAFRGARHQFQDLAQQFSNELDPRQRNQVKRLQEQFNGLKRKIDSRFKSLPDKKQLQLKNSVLEKAQFLEKIEEQLLACKDDESFISIRDQIDQSAWGEFAASGDDKYDAALNERLQCIVKADSVAALRSAAAECEAKARAMCIDLEIRANIDTPKEDQGLRMQIQLDQLKNAFGKLKPDQKENSSYAIDVQLQSYCLGPMAKETQQLLSQRIEGAVKKLL